MIFDLLRVSISEPDNTDIDVDDSFACEVKVGVSKGILIEKLRPHGVDLQRVIASIEKDSNRLKSGAGVISRPLEEGLRERLLEYFRLREGLKFYDISVRLSTVGGFAKMNDGSGLVDSRVLEVGKALSVGDTWSQSVSFEATKKTNGRAVRFVQLDTTASLRIDVKDIEQVTAGPRITISD